MYLSLESRNEKINIIDFILFSYNKMRGDFEPFILFNSHSYCCTNSMALKKIKANN